MKLKGHRKVGIVGSFWVAYFMFNNYPLWLMTISIYTFMLGNTAPDTLEFSRYDESQYFKRKSLIPHRTYTHWFVLWFALFLSAGTFVYLQYHYAFPVLTYAMGGLIHLLCDLPNPTGVPFLHPKKRRKSLNWWKSGENENLIAFVLVGISVYAMFILKGPDVYQWVLQFEQAPLVKMNEITQYFIHRLIEELKMLS